MPATEQVATVRRFNRTWTEVTALLDDSYLQSGLSLPEARLVYEVTQRSPQPVVELRGRLQLDPGYTTRLLDRLAKRGLITRNADPDDRRRQLVAVTESGRYVARHLAVRSDALVAELLEPLSTADREALVAALDTIAEMFGAPPEAEVRIRPAGPGELGWVLTRHAQVYQEEYGWPGFEAAVAAIIARFLGRADQSRQRFWVAERNGRLLGSVGCEFEDDETARLRLLLVEPAARGHRLGVRLVDECVAFARAVGYRRMVLHTQDALTAARAIYAKAGFTLEHTSAEDSLDPAGLAEHWELQLG
ncbi:bifunctional helix-turn-helix transcriptional regulator/GNAT family N-acetyltransferase [Cryptosporangium aurantiacum]|uniref:Transcriptional regulator, MarR family with acetyltransferase activity n=1 Tax=Cryptosporangium aurantiacum TaxID=134849 RepID=A0A1M7RGW6_9ACTN|nr:bifunctional helix-turn-helix transcriptional regulator/GNAT family N-acetyltransferase [Cryptosporangium aurantiacum]SHN45412.1 transcriptional regulator, MarR family with acetyltransferase activity [Cryptosporangium aurantiacum]